MAQGETKSPAHSGARNRCSHWGDPQRLRYDIARQEVCRNGRSATPLSLNDIELYLASRTILIDRIEFDAAILALDDAWRAEWAEEQKRQAKLK